LILSVSAKSKVILTVNNHQSNSAQNISLAFSWKLNQKNIGENMAATIFWSHAIPLHYNDGAPFEARRLMQNVLTAGAREAKFPEGNAT
jgi:hypothetical protein